MNVKKTRVGLLIAILTVALMFSLFTVSAFAETDASTPEATVATPAPEASDSIAPESSDTLAPEDSGTTAPAESSTPASTTSGAASTTAAPGTTAHDHDHENENDPIDTIISLIVGGVIILAIGIICIIKREPLGKFLRSLKSEMGKIVWLPKNQTIRSTIVVLIIVLACAIAIGLLDFLFGSGITFLDSLKK